MARQTERRSPPGTRLPSLHIRCPADIRAALKRQAEADETTPSAIVRGLLAAHVRRGGMVEGAR